MRHIELKPGMRVRCVVPDCAGKLQLGVEYLVEGADPLGYVTLQFTGGWWGDWRFKPVIRVKVPPHA